MESYNGIILDRKRVFFMYIDALSDSLSRLCDEHGLNYEDASRRCRCSVCYFSRIIRKKSVPSIAILENLCNGFGKTPDCLLQVSPGTEEKSYRTPMRIEVLRAYRSGGSLFTYPVCPRCDCTMEREYQAFCDRCGQRLSWKGFRKATVLITLSKTCEPL